MNLLLSPLEIFNGIGEGGFINFDDPYVIIANPRLDDPGPASIAAVFSEIRDHAYLPLYYLGLMPEAAIAGKDPAAFHLASLLWHAANGTLLLLLVMAVSGRRFVALGAALENVDLADLDELRVVNRSNRRPARALRVFPDGSFDGFV